MNSKSTDIADAFISTIDNPVIVLNSDFKIITFNESYKNKFIQEEESILGKSFLKINNQMWNIQILKDKLEDINAIQNNKEIEFIHEFKAQENKKLQVGIKKVSIGNEIPEMLILSITDNSAKSQTEQMLNKSKEEIQIRDKISEIFTTIPGNKVYDEVLQIILEIMESSIGYFGYINDEGALVSPSLTRKVWEKCEVPEKDIIFPKEQWGGAFGESLKKEKIVIKNEGLTPPQGHIPLENALCVPILYNNDLIGQIVVGNKDSDYTKEDQELLEALAKQISPILYARLERIRHEKQREEMEQKLRNSKKDEIIDYVDKQILNQLFKDGKKSLNSIKEHVVKKNGKHMSHTGINNRIDKLINSNILKIQGNINISELEYQAAIILVELTRYNLLEEYIEHLKCCPRIFLLAKVTGNYHLMFGIIGKSIGEINFGLNKCEIMDKNKIKNSELIFTPNLMGPEYIPIDLFYPDTKINKEKCMNCEYYENGECSGCGLS